MGIYDRDYMKAPSARTQPRKPSLWQRIKFGCSSEKNKTADWRFFLAEREGLTVTSFPASQSRSPSRPGSLGSNLFVGFSSRFSQFLLSKNWRRERDSNPRYPFQGKHAFQACAFNHSATSPKVERENLSGFLLKINRKQSIYFRFTPDKSLKVCYATIMLRAKRKSIRYVMH